MSRTCTQCRHRKVRCDGPSVPSEKCNNCTRLHFDCSFMSSVHETSLAAGSVDGNAAPGSSASPSGSSTRAGVERRRSRRACEACSSQKTRCSGESPKCVRCVRKGKECRYPTPKRLRNVSNQPDVPQEMPGQQSFPGSFQAAPALDKEGLSFRVDNSVVPKGLALFNLDEVQLLLQCDKVEFKRHFEAFFKYVYPISCYGFLHRALCLQDINRGICPLIIVRGICGAASIFLAKEQGDRLRAERWIEAAEAEIFATIDGTPLCKIQAIMLLIFYRAAARKYHKVLLLLSFAARMAYIKNLNYESNSNSFLMQESRRRLMWSIYILDKFYADGTSDFTVCSSESMHLNLPCDERSFELDHKVRAQALVPDPAQPSDSEVGIFAYLVRILDIKDRILRYTKSVVSRECRPEDSREAIQQFDRELQNFKASLPQTYHFTGKTLQLRAYSQVCTGFIMLHTFWHQSFCDLYRFTLPNFRESFSTAAIQAAPIDFITWCQNRCVEAAFALSRLFKTVLSVEADDDYIVTDAVIAICAYHCARILVTAPQIGTEITGQGKMETLSALQACLDIVTPLARVYPGTRRIQEDISLILESVQTGRSQISIADLVSPNSNNLDIGDRPGGRRRILSKHGTVRSAQMLDEENGSSSTNPLTEPQPTRIGMEDIDGHTGRMEMSVSDTSFQTFATTDFTSNFNVISPPYDDFADTASTGYNYLWEPYSGTPFDEAEYMNLADPFHRAHEAWLQNKEL